MSSFRSAITVLAEGLSSQPGGPDPSSSPAPELQLLGTKLNTPWDRQLHIGLEVQAGSPRPLSHYKYEKPKANICRLGQVDRRGGEQETVALSPA